MSDLYDTDILSELRLRDAVDNKWLDEERYYRDFGTRLRALRERTRLTEKVWAKCFGIPPARWRRIEAGSPAAFEASSRCSSRSASPSSVKSRSTGC